jgi:hypothetical protein
MAVKPEEAKAALVEKAVAHVHERLSEEQAGDVERFVRAYDADPRPRTSASSISTGRLSRTGSSCSDGARASGRSTRTRRPSRNTGGNQRTA